MIEEIRGVQAQAGLLLDRPHHVRVGIAQRVYTDTCNEIEVSASVSVPEVAAVTAFDRDGIAGVGLRQKLLFEFTDDLMCVGRFDGHTKQRTPATADTSNMNKRLN